MTIKELMPLDKAFHVRSAGIYNAMTKRFQEKRNKNGRILQVGRELPFKLHEFRDWLEEQLGGSASGIVKCAYCSTFISALDLRVDHRDPVSRGGELGFTNLALACSTCNTEKGELAAEEYVLIIATLDTLLKDGLLGPQGYTDVRKRLKGSLLTFRGKPQFKKKQDSYSGRSASTSSMFDPAALDDF